MKKALYMVLAVCMMVGFSALAFAADVRLGGGGGGSTVGSGGTGGANGAVITGTPGKTMTVTTPSGNVITPGSGVKK